MLTPQEKAQQAIELNDNYRALGSPREQILRDVQITGRALDAVLAMNHEDPTTVWMVRDYMNEKLIEQGKTPRPYSKGRVNMYFPYARTW